ncbi:putative ring zinc finger and vwf domain family protein [Paratrimastix pyriformis]|uniref:Ring zinc finger and vwf domain family protein n=1 Tax=Paratrimastix pyriformis TaxID=342808 RepID=A0ABQ8UIH9_9EUKA|nr:putative ring zinc finger and vwf domain family protein [Paratrimastix pyriformis]
MSEVLVASASALYGEQDSSTSRENVLMANLVARCQLAARSHIDLVLVIDRSGSMAGHKITLVKKTLHFIISQLGEGDSLAIVSYATSVSVNLPLTSMDASGKRTAEESLAQIVPCDATNLSGGLWKGLEQVFRGKNTLGSVLLMTDGQANAGITNTAALVSRLGTRLEKAGQKGTSITIHTFGFGADHQPELLRAIAMQARGMFYYVQNEQAIPAALGECMGGLLSVVAQSVELAVVPANGAQLLEILSRPSSGSSGAAHLAVESNAAAAAALAPAVIGSPMSPVPPPEPCELPQLATPADANPSRRASDSVQPAVGLIQTAPLGDPRPPLHHHLGPAGITWMPLGQMYADERRNFLVRVLLPALPLPPPAPQVYITFRVRYEEALGHTQRELEVPCFVTRPGPPVVLAPNLEVDAHLNRLMAARALEAAAADGRAGKLGQARAVVDHALGLIRQSPSVQDPLVQSLVADLVQALQGLRDRAAFDGGAFHAMMSRSYAHQTQRSAGASSGEGAAPCYATQTQLFFSAQATQRSFSDYILPRLPAPGEMTTVTDVAVVEAQRRLAERLLTRSACMVKHGRQGRPHERWLSLRRSASSLAIGWAASRTGAPSGLIELAKVSAILLGQQTLTFLRHGKGSKGVKPEGPSAGSAAYLLVDPTENGRRGFLRPRVQ